jgi:hypothetical protein
VLCDNLEAAVANAGLVIEAVPEQLELKRDISRSLIGWPLPMPCWGATHHLIPRARSLED